MRFMKLRHVADIRNSNVDKVIVDGEQPIRLCNYVDVYKNDFIEADMKFSAGSATKAEIKAFGLREGDVIITKDSEDRNDIGVPALVRSTAPDLVCGYHLSLLRTKKGVAIGPFLFWALLSKPAREAFSNAAYGITRFGMTLGGMKNVAIPLPDLATQRRIADFLDRETARIDRAIEKKQRLVELLGAKLAAEIETLVQRGIQQNAVLVETGIEWMPRAPKNWQVRRIASIFTESAELGGPEDLPILSVSINWGISDKELGDEDRHRIVNHIADRQAYKRVRKGDLVYNMMRAWQGAFGVAKLDGLVSPAYVVARPEIELHTEFFEHLLRTKNCIEEFRRASKGIADFRQRLYWEHFRQVRVALPPLEEQQKIAGKAAELARRTSRVRSPVAASITRLREYRAALITAAVTGQIDVEAHARSGTTERRLDTIEQEAGA